jgi:hypothetical protein
LIEKRQKIILALHQGMPAWFQEWAAPKAGIFASLLRPTFLGQSTRGWFVQTSWLEQNETRADARGGKPCLVPAPYTIGMPILKEFS